MENNPFRIVRHVLRTEKGTQLEPQRKYIFCVDKRANKLEVKKAIEHIYRVKVSDVHTAIVHGKMRRIRMRAGKTPDWKKAIVTLQVGQQITIS
ncbi:MAG: 50S ribosomal protein L23 [Candidatus Omnitrophica bacterium]|nr:50S ribosomal protein L23 [Candidatus Omnitrophota bacterium]